MNPDQMGGNPMKDVGLRLGGRIWQGRPGGMGPLDFHERRRMAEACLHLALGVSN